MSDLPIDPNLRGLLIELAERPETVALGARVHRFQDLLRPDTVTIRPTTGMVVIEAKLLEAHRDELAHLLLQASQVAVADAVLLKPRDRKGNPRAVDPAPWRRAARSFVESRFADSQPMGPLELLKRTLAQGGAEPTPRELAIASLRLVPRTATTIWIGVHCGLEGDRERGIQLQRSALNDSVSGYHAAYAWENIAWLGGELGRFIDCLEAAKAAAMADPESPRSLAAWFLAAVQVGSRSEATRAATTLADVILDCHDSLQEHVDVLRKSRDRGSWSPTAEAMQVVPQLVGRIPDEAEQLLEAFG